MKRRDFLKMLGLGAAAGAAASVPVRDTKAAPTAEPALTFEQAIDDFMYGDWTWRERGYKYPIVEKLFAREDHQMYKCRRDFVNGTSEIWFRHNDGHWAPLWHNVRWVTEAGLAANMAIFDGPKWTVVDP